MIYRNYEFSVLATLFSVFMSLFSFAFVLLGIFFFIGDFTDVLVLNIILGVVFVAAALFTFFYLGNVVSQKIANIDVDRKLHNKPAFCANFCSRNPEAYEAVCQINPVFAETYEYNEAKKYFVKKKV
ncbi:MAG TPA: hypothetical protein PKV44_04675 [Bacillota bacterium]|nr:hypothetical protein [Bacillota bacterium]